MKRKALMFYKFLVLLIGIVVIYTNLAFAYDLEKYHPLDQGNSWIYSVMEDEESYKETVRIEGKEIIGGIETVRMFSGENEYKNIAIDSEGIKEYKDFDEDEYKIYNPPKLIFPNIEIGKIKEYFTNWNNYRVSGEKRKEGTETGRIKLESIENIEVPAGKFTDCLKFSLISDSNESDGEYERKAYTIWLAPEVGKVKGHCFIIEYDPKTEKTETEFEIYELTSAVIDGKQIGGQGLSTKK